MVKRSSLIRRRGYIVLEMAEGKDTHTAEQEKESIKRPPRWKRLWDWTEFGKKSGWNWLELLSALAIPVVLAAGFYLEAQLDERQHKIEEQRANLERELEEQRAQDAALQAYLDRMSTLVLEDLGDPKARTLARTLTVLGRLDPSGKTAVMQFLGDAELVQRVEGGREPIIPLSGADLRDANLRYAALDGAWGENDEQLSAAKSLEGATMPNGQKYEDWLKSKDRGGA